MKRIIENHLAEIIVLSIMLIAFSSCTSTHYVCDAYAVNDELNKELMYTSSNDCENCDEID